MADIIRVASNPGVKRDGTKLDGGFHVDALWCRWQNERPRKMGGYRAISKNLSGIVRTLHGYTADARTHVHAGSAAALEYFFVDGNGNTSVIADRTPGALTASSDNMWQFDVIADGTSGTTKIVAQVAANLDCICSTDAGQLFIGDLIGTSALTQVNTDVPANFDPSGGVVCFHPFTFVFGQNGYVAWSVPGDPTDFTGSGAGNAYVTGQKIIRGMSLPGSPSGLFWSADSLIRSSYIGGTAGFQFDTISSQISILGAQTVIEYNGVHFWIGTDRFFMFNGALDELPNPMNGNWFFDNINMAHRQKCFAVRVPRFSEIWWCFPFGSNTECSHAIIYNFRLNTWYDTELPNSGRAAGLSPAVFRRPMMTGVDALDYTATAAAISDGGTGYAAGEILTVSGGIYSVPVELTVDTVSAGVITAVSISNAGTYTTTPSNAVATTSNGSGADAEFNLTFIQPYRLWIHEIGVDEIVGTDARPVRSYYETGEIALPVSSGEEKALEVSLIEPDFVQSGDLQVTVTGRTNARATARDSATFTIPETASVGSEQVVNFREQRRLLGFRFESNTVGGDYQAGHILAHVQKGDERVYE